MPDSHIHIHILNYLIHIKINTHDQFLASHTSCVENMLDWMLCWQQLYEIIHVLNVILVEHDYFWLHPQARYCLQCHYYQTGKICNFPKTLYVLKKLRWWWGVGGLRLINMPKQTGHKLKSICPVSSYFSTHLNLNIYFKKKNIHILFRVMNNE